MAIVDNDPKTAGPQDCPDVKSGSPLRFDRTARPSRRKIGISASLRQDRKTKYVRNSKTISGRLHDELVMMDLDKGKYFSLNPVATRIWDLLEKPMTTDDLCIALMEEYDVESGQCRVEVDQYLEEMNRLGLVAKKEC